MNLPSTAAISDGGMSNGDRIAHYWNAYFRFRMQTGLNEFAMRDLIRAIKDDVRGNHDHEEATRLRKLAKMIEVELEIAASERAQAHFA